MKKDLLVSTASARLIVLPTRVRETFGLVALEAQACGTPVVAADVGGLPMAVGGGVLVPDHEVDSWADALTGVLADPARRAALSRRAVAHAARFGWPVTTDRLLAVYGEAVAHRRAAYRTAG